MASMRYRENLAVAHPVKLKVSENEDGRVKFEAYPPNIRHFLVQLSLEALLNLRVGVQHILADIDDAVARQSRPRQEQSAERDRLLSPEEAAGQFSVTRRWLLDHADDVPGSRRLSRKVIRFSERGLSRYLNGRKAA